MRRSPLRSLGRTVASLSLLGGVLSGSPAQALTEAGTVISNRAEITWTDALTGESARASSNASTVVVGVVRDVELDGVREVTARAGESVSVPYRLRNTGNIADLYALSVVPAEGEGGALDGLDLHRDLNGNGVVDAGEPPIDETPLVEPGESIALIVVARVPDAAVPGELRAFELHVAGSDGTSATGQSTITPVEGAELTVGKVLGIDCLSEVEAGRDVDVRIDFANGGDAAPDAREHLIDGVPRHGVLVVDRVPDGLRLLPARRIGVAPQEGIVLVHEGESGNDWTSYSRWDGRRSVRRIALYLPASSLGPDGHGWFAFSLNAVEPLPSGIAGQGAAGVDLDGDGRDEFSSDPVCDLFSEPDPGGGEGSGGDPATVTALSPAAAILRAGTVPDFSADEDFVKAGSLALDKGRGNYDAARDGLYLELRSSSPVDARRIGVDGRGRSAIELVLASRGTGDTLRVALLETGVGSGVFRSVRPVALGSEARGGGGHCPGGAFFSIGESPDFTASAPECSLLSGENDSLRVRSGGESDWSELTGVIGPSAIVFDAYDLRPVPGATITIRQGRVPLPARLRGSFDGARSPIADDPLGGEPLVIVSDERGVYDVPVLQPGARYHVHVEPPAGWRFPSGVSPDSIPARRVMESAYGAMGIGRASGVFDVVEGEVPPLADIPLDPVDGGSRLALVKRALAAETEPGGVVAYALEVANLSEAPISEVQVEDRLPFGFKLVRGTTRIDGERAPEPDTAPDGVLGFALGSLASGARREIGYVLEATAGAIDGDGVNTARASARTISDVPLLSAESRAQVRIARAGVLSDRATLFGKVFVDADCNALQNAGEWPVGGVRLYLDDGTFVITDENGQFSLPGLAPGTRVLRADPISVPEGLVFKPIDNANAAAGDSRFVELAPGDFHRADFGFSCPSADIESVLAEIRERNRSIDGSWSLEALERAGAADGSANVPGADRPSGTATIDIDGDLSNGILDGPDAGRARTGGRGDVAPTSPAPPAEPVPAAAVPTGRAIDPEVAAADITFEQARAGTWLWPRGSASLDGRFVAVVPAGIEPTLYVEGRPVPGTRLGERIENRRERAQIVAWYGVALASGPNRIEVRGVDAFGNARVLAEGEFTRPASGTRLSLRARSDTLPADGGRSALPIEIVVLDENGHPARGVHFVTLETSETAGAWSETDLRPDEPGHQVRVEDGRAIANLRSSDVVGTFLLRASAAGMGAKLRVFQVAASRPLFGVGLLEIGAVSGELMGEGFTPGSPADALGERTRAEGRLSVFLKGQVRRGALLTLAYDSDKDEDTRLLRDALPGEGYPLRGDASIRGYEAQSRGKLYARLEKGGSSVMWGDYTTDVDADADIDDLARVRRVLTGFNARHAVGRARFSLFAAGAEEGRRVEEIPGNGTAMLFRLEGAPIVPGSEIVELIVRDRENPGLVISTERLAHLGDYTLDPVGGALSFAEPVPSVDADLNPVFVRVAYDQELGGPSHTVAGVRARVELSEELAVGASFTDDAAPLAGGTLAGGWLAWRPTETTEVTLDAARATHADGREPGGAQRLGVEHRWDGQRERRTSLTAARAERGFDNADSGIEAGRRELKLVHREQVSPDVGVELNASHSESPVSGTLRGSVGATFERSLERWSVRGGARRIRQRNATGDEAFTTAVAGAVRRFAVGERPASADIEYEQDIARSERNRIAFGTSISVHEYADLRLRYERQNSIHDLSALDGRRTSETLVAGVESGLIENTRLYSEYRMRGGIGGRDLVAASGVRGHYELAPGLTLSPAVEVIDAVAGEGGEEGVALSVGARDTRNPNVRTSARGEYRKARRADYIGLRASYAARLNLDWTAMVQESLRHRHGEEGERDLRHAFTLGLARRPRLGNRHHLLFQYRWKVERTEAEAGDRDVHAFSTHQNVTLGPALVLAGRLGAKRQRTFLSSERYGTAAYLADVRAIWDIDRRWSLDLRAGVLATGRDGRSRRHALGVGISHVLERNLLLQLGYNVTGFRDEDLDPEGYDAQGIRFGVRYKFDETAFGWLDDR